MHKNNDTLIWNTALYIRLSKEDGDKEESDSIKNQKNQILNYIETKPNFKIFDIYIDYGYSGTNFERPAFKKMINAIKNEEINCIIVKDLSRFGRNYIEVGNYIENIFPILNIRFISINEKLDSIEKTQKMNSIIVPFKNILNDSYSRDLSTKIKSALDINKRKGNFIGAHAPYGYIKSAEDKHKLIIDDEAAKTVRDIFNWYVSGIGKLGIAKKLNELRIPSPINYKKAKGSNLWLPAAKDNIASLWSTTTINRILSNKVYIGHMVQNKTKIISYKSSKRIKNHEDNFIIVKNTHEAIIDKTTFEKAQILLKQNANKSHGNSKIYPLSGVVKCADCGREMSRQKNGTNKKIYYYYICTRFRSYDNSKCTRHSIRCDKLEQSAFEIIRKQIELAVSMEEIINKSEKTFSVSSSIENIDNIINHKNTLIFKFKRKKQILYEDWKNNLITKNDFIDLKNKYDKEIQDIKDIINKLSIEKDKVVERTNNEKNKIKELLKYKNITKLDRDIVNSLIDEILVHEGNKITIKFKFMDIYDTYI